MKTTHDLQSEGYDLLSIRAGSSGKISSFIANFRGSKVYGYYDHVLHKYIIEPY